MTAPPTIQVSDLTVRFGQVTAVDTASFTVAPRQCFGVVGESGSGKTTVLRAILGLQSFDAGKVSLIGTDQPARGRDFRAQTTLIQPIFQDPATSLSPRRRIGQLLAEVGEVLREPAEACRLRAIAMLDRLGLPWRAAAQEVPAGDDAIVFYRQLDAPTPEAQEAENAVYRETVARLGLALPRPERSPARVTPAEGSIPCGCLWKAPTVGWDGRVTTCTRWM